MSNETVKKVIIGFIVLVVLVPVLPKLMGLLPEAVTFDRIEPAFTAAGMAVSEVSGVRPGGLGAEEEISMVVNGASVTVYRFASEGKIAAQLEYQKPDAGSAMVEAWNIGASLGAAPPKNRPSSAGRNGKFMIVSTGEDKAVNQRIVEVFKAL